MYDVIIVGAGPIGLSCAIAAKKRGFNYLVLEKGFLVNSIFGFPVNMNWFSTAPQIEIGGIPFTSASIKPTRLESLQYYRRVTEFYDLNIKTESKVEKFVKRADGFDVIVKNGSPYKCKQVVLALGYFDNPNMLNVPGEELAKVTHFYKEAHEYYKKNVVVVGGRNSAIEAALEIYRSGGNVTLIHRREQFDSKVKYWLKPDIENRIAEGSIKAYFNSNIREIKADSVRIDQNEKKIQIENDYVLALTGYTPDTTMMVSVGVNVNPDTLVPEHNPETLETNVPGLYISGTLTMGREANKVFIENGRVHGEKIIKDIKKKLKT